MNVAWISREDFLSHDTGQDHPERPDRLRAVAQAFDQSGLATRLAKLEPRLATIEELQAIHSTDHIRNMEAVCKQAPALADSGDTRVSPDSYDVARLASGGAVVAADAIMGGRFNRVFSAHRPPGHHAERDRAMGFCLFNHIAIAADHLTRKHGLDRVAIVDFDVHHGNGTQHSFEERADVLFISIHQDPRTLYPGTGFAHETGRGPGEGFTLNVPMPPGSGDADYRAAFEKTILPKLEAYKPQFLLISAGFDAMAEDPLAGIELTDKAYDWMTQRLVEIANRHCDGRILSLLEGGYDLDALARAAVAHVKAIIS